jgi:hypothetical protein
LVPTFRLHPQIAWDGRSERVVHGGEYVTDRPDFTPPPHSGRHSDAQPSKAARKRRLTASSVRSAVSNGSLLLADADHRSAKMRRLRDLIVLHEAELGEKTLSEGERRLVRRCAFLCLQLEIIEERWAQTGDLGAKSIELYQRVTNTLRRTLETLGLKRGPKDITPTLSQILREGVCND